jgi:ribulose-phosphate 3-epimerase
MDWFHLENQLREMQSLGIDYLHFDVSDSYFVPQFALPFYIINKNVNKFGINSDYHLMVEEPKHIFDQIPLQEGAIVGIHYEACRNLHRDLVTLRKLGFSPSLIINPATGLEHIEYVIEEVNTVTIMTVNPGSPSQQVIPQTLRKIERLRDWREKAGYQLDIMVDGNVSFENIPKMVAAGANILVLGTSSVFCAGLCSIEEGFLRLHEVIDEGLGLRNLNEHTISA